MKRTVYLILVLISAISAQGDMITLRSGKVINGRFLGFSERKFDFRSDDGDLISEYPVDVKSIVPTVPLKVSVELTRTNYVNVAFRSFDEFTLHLGKDEAEVDERVIMLKTLTVNGVGRRNLMPPDKNNSDGKAQKGEDVPPPEAPRDWQRSGKWREMEAKGNSIISKGEDVDIQDHLKKGFINIVHIHYPKVLASVREGNYVEALAAKYSNKICLLKIVVPDFKAPVCESLGIKSLPQFWFYDAQGRLVKKLTDRFTEGDIDDALKLARRSAN